MEVAHLMGLMAAELGIDTQLARRTGLLHDIGKAVSHEMEGPHATVGADLIRRYGESEAVTNGVASHHNDVPPIGPLGILVSAADAISARATASPARGSEPISIGPDKTAIPITPCQGVTLHQKRVVGKCLARRRSRHTIEQ